MKTQTLETDSPLAQTVESKHAWRTAARKFSPTVLEIVALFDEESAREAAENLCDRVLTQLGPRYSVRLLPWKLSVTEFPILTDIVAGEAVRSPFLLVTIKGEIALTPKVESFIRRCADAMRCSGGALVVQLHGIAQAQKESSPAYQCLSCIAEEAKIPIFSTVVELKQSRGAGRASPNRSGFPVAIPPQNPTQDLANLTHAQRP